MKLDKLMRYWPIAVLVLSAGALTAAVAQNTDKNEKQDVRIERIEDWHRVQAATNAKLEADSESTKEDVKQILNILLEGKVLGSPR